jgi:hypothetical protein
VRARGFADRSLTARDFAAFSPSDLRAKRATRSFRVAEKVFLIANLVQHEQASSLSQIWIADRQRVALPGQMPGLLESGVRACR